MFTRAHRSNLHPKLPGANHPQEGNFMKVYMQLSMIVLCVAGFVARASSEETVKPVKAHDLLKSLAGEWTFVTKVTADGNAAESPGTEKSFLSCNGLWLMTEYEGARKGLPFQGRGMLGYDTDKKKYINAWVDCTSTSLSVFEGSADDSGRTLTLVFDCKDAATGITTTYKKVIQIKDADHNEMHMYIVGSDGKETEAVSASYTRKK